LVDFYKTAGYHVTQHFSRSGGVYLTLICVHGDEVSRSVSVAKQKILFVRKCWNSGRVSLTENYVGGV